MGSALSNELEGYIEFTKNAIKIDHLIIEKKS
jgi:hypothetical protein